MSRPGVTAEGTSGCHHNWMIHGDWQRWHRSWMILIASPMLGEPKATPCVVLQKLRLCCWLWAILAARSCTEASSLFIDSSTDLYIDTRVTQQSSVLPPFFGWFLRHNSDYSQLPVESKHLSHFHPGHHQIFPSQLDADPALFRTRAFPAWAWAGVNQCWSALKDLKSNNWMN